MGCEFDYKLLDLYDSEAIMAHLPFIEKIGYVANVTNI